jgi:hypothetical protein
MTLIVMSVIMLEVAFYLLLRCVSFAECRYAECSYDECRGAQEMLGLAEIEVKRSGLLNKSVSDEEKSLVTLTPCRQLEPTKKREKSYYQRFL